MIGGKQIRKAFAFRAFQKVKWHPKQRINKSFYPRIRSRAPII